VTRHRRYREDSMYGLTAIQQANGWAMAGAGACIVLSGLAVLSFLISMIPRLTGFFEEKKPPQIETARKEPKQNPIFPDKLPDDIKDASTIYMSLTEELGEDFSLIDLHRVSREVGLVHPHISINRFRYAGILVPNGHESFTWKPL